MRRIDMSVLKTKFQGENNLGLEEAMIILAVCLKTNLSQRETFFEYVWPFYC